MRGLVKRFRERVAGKIDRILNGLGKNKRCYICARSFNHFTKHEGGSKGQSQFRRRLNMVGSDGKNYGCMYCGSHDRERHLFMFFDELNLWGKMRDARILHFAPEKHLPIKIREQAPSEYIMADLYPKESSVQKHDATELTFENDEFDIVIANHVLEHIMDYSKALSEFHRVLKPGGMAVLQTPYSKLLKNNFEDESINTDELRLFFYGTKAHVRIFGRHSLLKSLTDAGFILDIKKHDDFFNDQKSYIYGVNKKEDLVLVRKPPQA